MDRQDKIMQEMESRALRWVAEYNEMIKSIRYDSAAELESACKKLIFHREKVLFNSEMLNSNTIDTYFRLHYMILFLGYHECDHIPQYEIIAKEFQHMVEEYQVDIYEGIDCFLFSNEILAHYYYKVGNILTSVAYYEKILDRVKLEDRLDRMTFVALISLCRAYLIAGNRKNAKKMGGFLYKKYQAGMVDDLSEDDIQRLYFTYANACALNGLQKRSEGLLMEYLGGKQLDFNGRDDEFVILCLSLVESMNQSGRKLNRLILLQFREMVEEVEHSEAWGSWDRVTQASAYMDKALICAQLEDEPEARASMEKAFSLYQKYSVQECEKTGYLAMIANGMRFYASREEWEILDRYSRHLLEQLPGLLSYAEYYLDDVEMEDSLLVCEQLFWIAYSYCSYINKKEMETELFSWCVNYKNTLLSVVRNRNCKINKDKNNVELLKSVNRLKDQIAETKNCGKKKGFNAEREEKIRELKELEYKFSSQHKKNDKLGFIDYEHIITGLPENAAIVEIIYVDRQLWKDANIVVGGDDQKIGIDLFVIVKKESLEFRYLRIDTVYDLDRKLDLLMKKVSNPYAKFRKEAKVVFDMLFAPVRDLISGVSKVFLSPHKKLCNIPFELIFESLWEEGAGAEIVYVQSFRDFLENSYEVTEDFANSCIIGSPMYSQVDQEADNIEISSRMFDIDQIRSLPYSRYEVESIASQLGAECMIGEQATKYQIKPGYSYLHIATHGLIQEIGDRNGWYNSALAFAGVADWYAGKPVEKRYGNGLLTAEEISRMDFGSTKLAVLSACNSGISEFSMFERQSGLHLAFGVAGVKYVVSALWSVDDLATSILMKFFYKFLLKGKDVPEALSEAKRRIRNLTVGELREILEVDMDIMHGIGQRVLNRITEVPSDRRLYHAPKYWAAFICYEYRK